jgi:hypothetical protein
MLAAPLLGMAAVWAAWLVLGGAVAPSDKLDSLQARLSAGVASSGRPAPDLVSLTARLASTPVFALTTGPGAVTDVKVRLEGLSITPHRQAALLSINDGPPVWLELGASQGGVTLISVQPTKATVDTIVGFKDVGLWDPTPSGAGEANGGTPSAGETPANADAPPPGTRLPPPPASAPRTN